MRFAPFILGTASLMTASLFAVAMPQESKAAVTVIGQGPAESCYDGAENNRDPAQYILYCTEALNGVLSSHDRAATYINRGVLKLAQTNSDGALADFNSGLTIDPAIAEGYIDRGASLIAQKKFSDAIQDIDKGLSLGAKKAHIAYYDRAIADEAVGDIPGAYKDYRQALAVAPDFTLASEELKRFKVVRKSEGS